MVDLLKFESDITAIQTLCEVKLAQQVNRTLTVMALPPMARRHRRHHSSCIKTVACQWSTGKRLPLLAMYWWLLMSSEMLS